MVNRAMVLCTDDKAMGREIFRAAFSAYYATPVYNKFLAWAGYEDAAAAIAQGWARKNREKTAGALTDELIDEIAIIGTEDEIRSRIWRMPKAACIRTSLRRWRQRRKIWSVPITRLRRRIFSSGDHNCDVLLRALVH